MSIFRPAWANDENPVKAAKAVSRVKSEVKLMRIAMDKRCCDAALAQIALKSRDSFIGGLAAERISGTDLLARVAQGAPHWNVRAGAYRKLGKADEANTLVALNGYPHDKVKAIQSGGISEEVLLRIYREDKNAAVRCAALRLLPPDALLAVFLEGEKPFAKEAGYCLVRQSAQGASEWIVNVDEAALEKMTGRCFEDKLLDACALIRHVYRKGKYQDRIARLNGLVIFEEKHNDSESHYQDLGDHVDYGHSDYMIPPEVFTLE